MQHYFGYSEICFKFNCLQMSNVLRQKHYLNVIKTKHDKSMPTLNSSIKISIYHNQNSIYYRTFHHIVVYQEMIFFVFQSL